MADFERIDSELDATQTFRTKEPAPKAAATLATVATVAAATVADGENGSHASGPVPAGYELRQRIGRGGMGEVWEALQVSLGRVVAVKRPIDGGAPEDVSRRAMNFRQEALVAAQLEHPNIVPVHDQGTDAAGRPLLAMKLVQGQPWNKMLARDFKELSPEDLLAKHLPILVDMTQAVAFAHSKGIIHRDLKPAQVMVGGFGEVMLMDWGLAMFVGDPNRLERSVREDFPLPSSCSNPSGTPALMAPEQVHADASRLSERTDVYLLGGTLYYLLTGTYPHEAASAREALQAAAAGHVEDPRRRAPNRTHPDDLVRLCLAALAPNPKDRPQSALEFLDALRDHLSGSTRRREAVAIAERLEARLDGGMRDYDALTDAVGELTRAHSLWPGSARLRFLEDRLNEAYAAAALEREDLHLAELHARRVGNAEASQGLLVKVEGLRGARRRQAAQRRLAVAIAAGLLAIVAVGASAFSVRLREERDAANRARQVALDERDRAERERVRAEEAEDVAERRRALVEAKSHALGTSRANAEQLVSYMISDLRDSLIEIGRLDLLTEAASKTRAYYESIPFDDYAKADKVAALGGIRELVELLMEQESVEEAASLADYAVGLARDWAARGTDFPQAEYDLLQGLAMRARVARVSGNLQQALDILAEAVPLGHSLVAADPGNNSILTAMSIVLADLGNIYEASGDFPKALEAMKESTRVMEEMLEESPEDLKVLRELSARHSNLAGLAFQMGRQEEAAEHVYRSRELMEHVFTAKPDDPDAKRDYAVTLRNAAEALSSSGETKEAEEMLEQGLSLIEGVYQENPSSASYGEQYLNHLYTMGMHYQRTDRMEEAVSAFRRGAAVAEELSARVPENRELQRAVAVLNFRLGRALPELGDLAGAEAAMARNNEVLRELVALDEKNYEWASDYASSLHYRGDALASVGRFEEVEPLVLESIARYESFVDRGLEVYDSLDMIQAGYLVLASVDRELGENEAALANEAARIPIIERLIAMNGRDAGIRRELVASQLNVGSDNLRLGNTEAALAALAAARGAIPANADRGASGVRWRALLARATVLEGRIRLAMGEDKATALLEEGHAGLLAVVAEMGIGDTPGYNLLDLIRSARALGIEEDPAWAAELTARGFYDEPFKRK